LRELRAELARTRSRRDDAELLLAEWNAACAIADCALARGLGETADWASAISAYREQWLARNRPGGLDDSMSLLKKRAQG
ncbi:MAG: hypothetical protein NZ740_10785, partial [Kiritimatiellae bacterium]|nr:hypothetical protein [Kiritimatiellia bacterium]MDW8459569.1 hypothetical protein [Verrucomicrobiota bacterium]